MATPITAVAELDESTLRRQINETQLRLNELETDLQNVQAELDAFGNQRETYDLLEQIIGSLEQLDAIGVANLFWGDGAEGRTEQHAKEVRERSNALLGRIGEIEGRRDALLAEMRRGEDLLDLLEADLDELLLIEEERLQEWEIERELVEPEREVIMPWGGTPDEQQRLRKSLSINLLVALLIGAIIPMIDLPLPELDLIPEVPERFANLIERELPPPPPPVEAESTPEPEPEPVDEVEPEEPLVVEELPEEIPEEVPVEPTAVAEEEAAPEAEVRSAGILAFRESIGNIDRRQPAQLGAQAQFNDAGESEVGRTERAMVTSQAPGSSGGINLASLSRDVGGGGGGEGLSGVQVTRVASSIGVSGTGDRPLAGGASAGRTDEEIQIVFDRHKAQLYRSYNRELRNNPTLRGQVVLRLTIEADGSVSMCEVESSTMGAPALEQQIVNQVKTFDFGAKEGITAITILYPIDFLPAG
jgi:TonB family protein